MKTYRATFNYCRFAVTVQAESWENAIEQIKDVLAINPQYTWDMLDAITCENE